MFEAAARVNGSQLRQELMSVKQCVNALTRTTKWAPSTEYALNEDGASSIGVTPTLCALLYTVHGLYGHVHISS